MRIPQTPLCMIHDTTSPVTLIETDPANQFAAGLELLQNQFRADSEIFKVGIVENFSCNFPQVENIVGLYIGPDFWAWQDSQLT
jgi:hypothetical protein